MISVAPSDLKTSCCNNGMYHASLNQECAYEDDGKLDGLERMECRQSFMDCCNSFTQTNSCKRGISQALNSSFCPYIAWDLSPSLEEKISRSCCESCLKGVHDNENAVAANLPKSSACKKPLSDFNNTREYDVYLDCCNKRLGRSMRANHAIEEAESEVISRSSGMQAYSRRNLPLTQTDKPCSEQNICAHFCIDAKDDIPKHCACRSGYFLTDDGGSCRSVSYRYSNFRSGSDPCIVKPNTYAAPYVNPGSSISREEHRETHSYRTEVTGGHPSATPDTSSYSSGGTQIPDSEVYHRQTTCGSGYELNPISHSCVDIDECRQRSPCTTDETCINYDGGFYCRKTVVHHESNVDRQQVNPVTSYRSQLSTTCDAGLIFNSQKGYCVDEDECAKLLHNCRENEVCRNTYRNYTCDCKKGYNKDYSGYCVDVDECNDLHYTLCPKQESICLNTPGSYRCLCKEGFVSGVGESCSDVDECQQNPNICGINGICLNTYGSYKCRCQPGFTLSSDSSRCEDIDECNSGRKMCVGRCENVPGSFRCTCPPGFRLDSSQRICEDIDECQERNTCHSGESCLNTMGHYKCYSISCPTGYYQDPNRENRCVRRQIKQVYDTQTQVLRYEDNAPHYVTFNHLTLACNLTDLEKPFYDFGFDSSREEYDFRIKVKRVSSPPNVIPASDSSFRIQRKGRSGASVHLNQPLKGPQDIELEFSVVNRAGEIFYKSFLTIYVAEYDGVHF